MKVLSIDVGIKNLALCLLEKSATNDITVINWKVINLMNYLPHTTATADATATDANATPMCSKCKNTGKFMCMKQVYCGIHIKPLKSSFCEWTHEEYKRVEKLPIAELKALCKTFDISNKKKAEIFDLLSQHKIVPILVPRSSRHSKQKENNMMEFAKPLKRALDEFCGEQCDINTVVIEDQIGPLAVRMKMLQLMITQYFACIFPQTVVLGMSASLKLKGLASVKTGLDNYDERKKVSVELVRDILREQSQISVKFSQSVSLVKEQLLNTSSKKKCKNDDYTDAFLQGLAFFRS